MLELDIDVITLGNHVIASPCIYKAFEAGAPIIRPLNIPGIPGSGHIVIVKNDLKFLIINAIGYKYLNNCYDNYYYGFRAIYE